MKDAFQTYNTTKNGLLSQQQVQTMLLHSLDESTITRLFKEADLDNDGYISWKEYPKFSKMVQESYAQKGAHTLF
jgi:Ca2+-binding EF-hand superfamily protein